jgi:hypothetical protein
MISRGIRWSFFYSIPLALSLGSIGFMGWSYRGFEADASHQLLTALERTASRRAAAEGETTKRQLLWQSAKNRTTLLGALFIFFYQGGEVAISGWVISYLIQYRSGDPSQVGNVTSGFWGGITGKSPNNLHTPMLIPDSRSFRSHPSMPTSRREESSLWTHCRRSSLPSPCLGRAQHHYQCRG